MQFLALPLPGFSIQYHYSQQMCNCLYIVDEVAKCGNGRAAITGDKLLVRWDFEEIVKAFSRRNYPVDVAVCITETACGP